MTNLLYFKHNFTIRGLNPIFIFKLKRCVKKTGQVVEKIKPDSIPC